jgi:phosphatidylglycerol---prolipoprotein diacylglyceryl transferase
MILHDLDPVIFSLGPLSVRYYGLFYALGFVIAYFFLRHMAKRKHLPISKDDAGDVIFHIIIGTVVGARLFYVLFYNFSSYISNPLEILALWHGGLSFHGGLIGGVLGVAYFCKKKKMHFYDISDILAIPLALGLALGRVGNFINAELYGRATNVPWCIDHSQNQYMADIPEGCRHPSQIYESIYSLAIFATLYLLDRKILPKGTLTWLFVALYGLFRTMAEFFREPDAQLGFLFQGLTMGQLLSIPMFLLGTYMVWKKLSAVK